MVVLCNQPIDLLKMVENPGFFSLPGPQNSSNSSQFWILISDHPRMLRIQSQQLPTFQTVKQPNQWRGSVPMPWWRWSDSKKAANLPAFFEDLEHNVHITLHLIGVI